MNENHQKTGLAAFVLSLAGILTFGVMVIPALICAVISRRQSQVAGVATDGFATASLVISGFILALWGIVIAGFGTLVVMGRAGAPEWTKLSEEKLRVLMIATGTGIVLVLLSKLVMTVVRNNRRLHDQRRRMWKLAGRP